MLELLNQKIAENPDYPIPDGYKRVQEIVIEDSYHVPEAMELPESEKIALEVLDEVFAKALNGLHILQSVPVTRVINRVTIDESKIFLQAASRNIRAQS